MKEILLATNNEGKVERYRKLLTAAGVVVALHTPRELGIEEVDVVEDGKTLRENAEKKARGYLGKTSLPILANDTGFWVDGEGLVAAPKRTALGEKNETQLTQKEITRHLVEFWKGIARKHGGKVNAAWIEEFILLDPDGTIHNADSRRDVVLSDTEFGVVHVQMPVRTLYICKATNKPAAQQTDEEELLEMQPVVEALKKVLEI